LPNGYAGRCQFSRHIQQRRGYAKTKHQRDTGKNVVGGWGRRDCSCHMARYSISPSTAAALTDWNKAPTNLLSLFNSAVLSVIKRRAILRKNGISIGVINFDTHPVLAR